MQVKKQVTTKQTGVALITVMLILALATILAVSMSSRQRIDTHRSSNILNAEQAYQYVAGAEAWTQQILKRDYKINQNDSLKDDWAVLLPVLPIEGGEMKGNIEDVQARFNLNNLVQNGELQTLALERFKRLLRNLGLNENISATMVDWIDANELVVFSGAEDNEYLNLSPAYRAANSHMADVSELLLVNGVNFDSYEKLRPFVCVLQSASDINVNTASAEVLSSIENITPEDAQTIVSEREQKVYEKIEDFLQHPLLKDKKINKEGLSVASDYFQLNTMVKIDRINMEYTSVLYRNGDDRVIVMNRSRGIL